MADDKFARCAECQKDGIVTGENMNPFLLRSVLHNPVLDERKVWKDRI